MGFRLVLEAVLGARRRKKMVGGVSRGGGCSGSVKQRGFSANPKDYKLVEEVGHGASAVVYRAIYLPTKQVVAVKCLDLDRCNSNLFSLMKSDIKKSNSLFFKPFKPLVHHSSSLSQIDELISAKSYDAAMKLAVDLRNLSLEGLHYFQTYDWLMLMTVITLGYAGWMIVLALHVLQCYSSLTGDLSRKEQLSVQKKDSGKVYLSGCLLMAVLSVLNLVEHSPPLYHAYIGMTVFLWTQIFSEYRLIRGLWRYLRERKTGYFIKLLFAAAVSVVIVELLVCVKDGVIDFPEVRFTLP